MPLTLVSTPIGHFEDITLRAIETLKKCDGIICEELKPARVLLKRIGLGGGEGLPDVKKLYQLNEHSKPSDLKELIDLCRRQNIALVSDCGTPGFCDPGGVLVDACYKEKIPVQIAPGVTSLGALLSLTGEEIKEFFFVGFLPQEKNDRSQRS